MLSKIVYRTVRLIIVIFYIIINRIATRVGYRRKIKVNKTR